MGAIRTERARISRKPIIHYLLKISFSSCSDTNCPRLATKSVEQGGFGGCDAAEPTGDAKPGDGKKCGNDAWMDVSAVGCGIDSDG